MQHITFLTAALAAVLGSASAQSVSGSPEGFAAGTTGGAAGQTVTPSSTDELVSYLTASEAYTILITQEFDFTGTEGTASETGCAPWGTDSACQLAINANDWCSEYESSAPSVSVTYDVAGTSPIDVASDKTILGVGSSAVIKGKGLRLANGVSNIIIQNIAITELNPQYVWGGDAITLDGSTNVWIDHVKISLIGRMFLVSGYNANTGVTVSNSEFDGQTSWSATCNGEHYWTLFFTGQGDQITFKNNYIHDTSGRSPKVDAGSFVHVVNNYWATSKGHCFEGEGGYALVEGNTFENIAMMEDNWAGAMFAPSTDSSACASVMGRDCQANAYSGSPEIQAGEDTSAIDQISGLEIADAVDAASAKAAAGSAGNTLSVSGEAAATTPETGAVDSGVGASNATAPFPVSSGVASAPAVSSAFAMPVASSAFVPAPVASSAFAWAPVASSVVVAPWPAVSSAVPVEGASDDGDCTQLIYV